MTLVRSENWKGAHNDCFFLYMICSILKMQKVSPIPVSGLTIDRQYNTPYMHSFCENEMRKKKSITCAARCVKTSLITRTHDSRTKTSDLHPPPSHSFLTVTAPLQHGHLDRHARPETARHDVIPPLAHLPELVQHDQDRRAGRVAVVLVHVERGAQLLLVQLHLLLHAVEDGDAARVQGPVEVARVDGFPARGQGAVEGQAGFQLLEHGRDGLEGEDGHLLRERGAEARGVRHELELLGRVGHRRRLPVDEGVDGFVFGAGGQLVADDEGGGTVGKEHGRDLRLLRVLHYLF